MTTISANESISPLLAMIDRPNAEPLLLQDADHAGILLSTSDYALMRAAQGDDFDRVSEILSADAKARGLTQEKLAALLAEIDADAPR